MQQKRYAIFAGSGFSYVRLGTTIPKLVRKFFAYFQDDNQRAMLLYFRAFCIFNLKRTVLNHEQHLRAWYGHFSSAVDCLRNYSMLLFSNTIRQSFVDEQTLKILNHLLFLVIPYAIQNSENAVFFTNSIELSRV